MHLNEHSFRIVGRELRETEVSIESKLDAAIHRDDISYGSFHLEIDAPRDLRIEARLMMAGRLLFRRLGECLLQRERSDCGGQQEMMFHRGLDGESGGMLPCMRPPTVATAI